MWLGIDVGNGEKNVVLGERRNSIRMLFGEYGRYGYSCADNIKVNHENMEEAGKPYITVEASYSIIRPL